MPRLFRMSPFVLCFVVAVLAGCQLSGTGQGPAGDDVTPNAVTGGEIEVTALDAGPSAAPEGAGSPVAEVPVVPETTAAPEAAPAPVAAEGIAPPGEETPTGDADDTPAEAEDTAAEAIEEPAAAPEVPPEEKSEQQIACERKKGTWSLAGRGEIRICIFRTRDAGKRCVSSKQCDGDCLARSGTCSPIKPLIGCNEVLVDSGMRVTQCIE
jgi:hypothetical protein